MLFNIFIKNLGDRAECTLSKFTDGTKLEGAADRPAGCVTIQRHLDKLEKQDDRNLMHFCKGKYQVLTLLEQRVGQDELQHSLPTATIRYEEGGGDRVVCMHLGRRNHA